MLERALHSHFITNRHGAPLMIERDAGLIAVAALAADPNVGAKSGGLFSSWALSKEYSLTDVDGRRPDWGTFFPRKVQEILDGDEPTETDLSIVRTRLYQADLDPAAHEETERLRIWLARHG